MMKPILLNSHACALIMIYNRYSEVFEAIHNAYEGLDLKETYEIAAKEFISQLNGHQTRGFLKALKKEIEHNLENWGEMNDRNNS